jgi:hypothetical protein
VLLIAAYKGLQQYARIEVGKQRPGFHRHFARITWSGGLHTDLGIHGITPGILFHLTDNLVNIFLGIEI